MRRYNSTSARLFSSRRLTGRGIGMGGFRIARGPIIGLNILANRGNGVRIDGWREIAPSVTAVVNNIGDLTIIQFPAKPWHREPRGFCRGSSHACSRQHHMDDCARLISLDCRAAGEGWED